MPLKCSIDKVAQCAALALFLTAPVLSHAVTITISLPDIDGPLHLSTEIFPISIGEWNFNYSIPQSSTIISATLSGTFGTQTYPNSTAGFDVIIDGYRTIACAPLDTSCWSNGAEFRPFSLALPLSVYGNLSDGTATFEIIQTNNTYVRYGTPTLTINYAPVPEPVTATLLLIGLAGLLLYRKGTSDIPKNCAA